MCIKPEDLRKMAEELMAYIPTFEAFDVHVGFDCGMPMCIFTDEEIGKLFKHTFGNVNFLISISKSFIVLTCFG